MRCAVVGAGIAGLAAARTLDASGWSCVVFEETDAPGGRCETVSRGQFVFDSGATSIAPRGRAIESAMLRDLPQDDLVPIIRPIYTHDGSRVFRGDSYKNSIARYTYGGGNQVLPRMLAASLDVRFNTKAGEVEHEASGYRVLGEHFDAVVVAIPAPEASNVVGLSVVTRILDRVRYRSCLSVMLGYERPFPEVAYHALIEPDQRHPLTWLSIESLKSPNRAPESGTAMVAQLSSAFSSEKFLAPEASIVDATADAVARLFGAGWDEPAVSIVRRWKHSLPENLAMFDHVNAAGGTLVFAGDAFIGGRVELAYESGVQAARLLLEDP